MVADFDVMVARSPPSYHRSIAPSPVFYSTCRLQNHQQQQQYPKVSNPVVGKRHPSPMRSVSLSNLERKPRRPCLVTRSDSDSSSSSSGDENETPSPPRQKKKVVFADDIGFSLTQVKMMIESPYEAPAGFNLFPGYCGPKTPLSSSVFNCAFGHSKNTIPKRDRTKSCEDVSGDPKAETWKTTFSQPASNYLDFRRKIDEENVSLENVIIKQNTDEGEITGTIKVKNICFEKNVFIRVTKNDWLTYEDVQCTFVDDKRSSSSSGVVVLYDTFSFRYLLPAQEKSLQFCVCFKAVHGEHWDNNGGKNYVIVKDVACKPNSPISASQKTLPKSVPTPSRTLSWPVFASWTDDGVRLEPSHW